MNVCTRPAIKEDLDFARRTHHSAYRNIVVRQWGKWDEDLQDSFFNNAWDDDRFDIIMADGVACGYMSIEDRSDSIHLVELVLSPEYQCRGIGSTIVLSFVAHAENEAKPARLRTCIENHRAQAFYRRHGFLEIGRDDTHLLMERT